jgi:trafficking protein particle complex subunit 6
MSFDTPLPPYNASDPHATFLNSSCLDLLLIELVPMAYRIANEFNLSDEKLDDEEEREAVFYRLDMLGYRVGQGLAERCVQYNLEGYSTLCTESPRGRACED